MLPGISQLTLSAILPKAVLMSPFAKASQVALTISLFCSGVMMIRLLCLMQA
jgi:hypothetical protein